jgi:hypothetical protein
METISIHEHPFFSEESESSHCAGSGLVGSAAGIVRSPQPPTMIFSIPLSPVETDLGLGGAPAYPLTWAPRPSKLRFAILIPEMPGDTITPGGTKKTILYWRGLGVAGNRRETEV